MSNCNTDPMDRVRAIDTEVAHVWMIRTFLKHADEAEEDEDLRDIVRDLYDFILAVGPLAEVDDPAVYLKMAKKKFSKLRKATELYEEIQPEVSGHTNFAMAARSLRTAVNRIDAAIRIDTLSK
ncbi:MAG: amidohydrolase [Pirellulaceae bacterium]|nr:amidohydrolase [Pirellulaceae bacterium]